MWGCASNGGPAGTGGSSGTGGGAGTIGAAGTPGAAGTTGAAGKLGAGGSSGAGTGGAAGTGAVGTSGSGGAAGSGGATAAAGEGGKGGAAGNTSAAGGATGAAGSSSGGGSGGAGAGNGGGGTAGAAGGSGAVTVQLDQVHQTIEGFGINDTWGEQFASADADALFNTSGTGIGLTILRTGLSDGDAFYNTFESSNISALKSRAGSSAKVIGSVWSPPGSCKSGQTPLDSMNPTYNGGHLMQSCYDSWSTTIADFAGTNGFYAMSIGNEPDFASCGNADPCNGNYATTLFTAAEMVAWVKTAGPKLQAKGVKVIAPEASEWIHTWSNVSAGPDVGGNESSDPLKCACFPDKNTNGCASNCTMGNGYDYGHWLAKDATAWAAFDILGVHEYDTQMAMPWPSDVNGGVPNKEVWQTEMSGVKWWPEQGTGMGASLTGSATMDNGIAVAQWIHSALVDGEASAWLYWWYKAYNTDDNEGLLLKGGGDTRRHWTFGNFSKFVRPGYQRVAVTGNVPAGVLLSAYKGSDGTVVIVAINENASTTNVPITIAGGTAPASMTPNVTSATDNLQAGSPISLSGSQVAAALAASTVTTFVGK